MDGNHDPHDDESLADARSRLSSLSNLESFTARELSFLEYYLSAGGRHGDGIPSAARAGFTGSRRTLAVTASRILRKAYQGGLLRVLLEQHGAGLPEACKAVAGCLTARVKKAFPNKEGKVVVCDLGPDHAMQFRAGVLVAQLHGAIPAESSRQILAPNCQAATADDTATRLEVPDDLTASEQGLEQAAKDMGPAARIAVQEAVAAEEAIVATKLKLAQNTSISADADNERKE